MEAAIFEDLIALGDATRSRMLLLLERHELTVTELCAILQLP
jgi:DNA-binding transcriptional ArsR family regulator